MRPAFETAANAAKTAVLHGLTVYDAAYLDLAMRRRLPLATLHDDLKRAAKKARVKLLQQPGCRKRARESGVVKSRYHRSRLNLLALRTQSVGTHCGQTIWMIWTGSGAHGYKVLAAEGKTIVFYSNVFCPYAEIVGKLKVSSPLLVDAFVINYEIWIGYHATLEHRSMSKGRDVVEDERVRMTI